MVTAAMKLITLALWKKSYDQPREHIKKQRHYFANKGPLVKTSVFPVVMYGCESWTIKKAECQWIDAFELWCWRRLLTVPWTARRSNQSILKETNPEYALERHAEAESPIFWPPDTNSGRWWRTGKPGELQSMRPQRVRKDWATEWQGTV